VILDGSQQQVCESYICWVTICQFAIPDWRIIVPGIAHLSETRPRTLATFECKARQLDL
jgi:hypothetical protein